MKSLTKAYVTCMCRILSLGERRLHHVQDKGPVRSYKMKSGKFINIYCLFFYDTIILHEMIITLRSVPRGLAVKSL